VKAWAALAHTVRLFRPGGRVSTEPSQFRASQAREAARDPASEGLQAWAEWSGATPVRLLLCGHLADLAAVRRELTGRGAVVTIADPKREALAPLAGHGFDGVVIDRDLHDAGGRELFAAVRACWPDLPVIVLVGTDDDDAAVQAIEAGVDQCVIRTSAFHRRLPYAVRALLRRAEQQRRLVATVEELERVVSLAPVGIVVARTQDCTSVASNECARATFGAAPGANLSASAPEAERFAFAIRRDGRELSADEMPLQVAARTGRAVHNELLEFVGRDGRVVEFVTSAVPLHDATGQPRGAVATLQDVTALRAMQARLFDSEERLRLAVDHVGIGTWDVDLASSRSVWSRSQFEVLGYAPHPEGLANFEMWLSRVHPEDAARVTQAWREAVRTRSPDFRVEYRILRADDGEVRWLSSVGRFIAGPDGEHVRALGVFVDVTERRQREAQFRAILDNSGAALYATGRDGRLLFVNGAFEATVGKPAAELVGRSLTEVFDAGTAAALLAHNEVVMREGPQEYDESVRRGDEVRWFRSVKNPLYDASGAVVGIVGLSIDVTERRRAMEQIERHRRELQTMLEVLPVGVAIAHDAEARHVTGSRVLLETLRSQSRELDTRGPVPFTIWQGDRRLAREELPLERATLTGVPVRDFHLELRFDDGEVLHLMVNAAPLCDPDGAVRGGIAATVDVTALKLVQQELQDADRQKDEFLATLAHELRNPMAPIRYAAAMLRPDAAPEVLEHARATIARQSGQMARLLDDLLDMSRITRNVIHLERGTLDLRALVADAIDAIRPVVQQHGQTVSSQAPEAPVWVDGDPLRIVQVVGNLLNNACKYTPAGGRIEVSVEVDGPRALVRVKDDGVGLTPEMLPKVFDLFSQVHKGLTASKGGLGIGLAVAKRLTELHGGTLAVRSEGLGRGAEFTLALPRVTAARRSADPAAPAVAPRPCRALNVLVVDDNEDGAASLALLLRAQGIGAEVANTGGAALQLAEELRPDVILLDVGLPDISGLDVARRLRGTHWGARIRIVAVTGWGQELDRVRSRDAGVDEHLVKPVDPTELLALLRDAAPAGSRAAG
jgi:PAS domain S-box-containing protein